jgi:hypothetical protein
VHHETAIKIGMKLETRERNASLEESESQSSKKKKYDYEENELMIGLLEFIVGQNLSMNVVENK